jgi:hypothetical protein
MQRCGGSGKREQQTRGGKKIDYHWNIFMAAG